MVREMRGLLRPYGFLRSRVSVGGSVASAREANVSMMRFTQSICTALRGESYDSGRERTVTEYGMGTLQVATLRDAGCPSFGALSMSVAGS